MPAELELQLTLDELGVVGQGGREPLFDLQLEPLHLRLNRRSGPAIVERVKVLFHDYMQGGSQLLNTESTT